MLRQFEKTKSYKLNHNYLLTGKSIKKHSPGRDLSPFDEYSSIIFGNLPALQAEWQFFY